MKPEELLIHSDFMNVLARALIWDENRAADVTQEAWLAALKHPPSTAVNVKAWFSKVMRNANRMMTRADTRRAAREERAHEEAIVPTPAEIAAQEETRRLVVDAVLSLDGVYRDVIVLRYYKDLSHQEAARRLDIPLETLRTRLKRGMEQLRIKLDKVHGGERTRWLTALAPFAGLDLVSSAAKAAPLVTGALIMSAKAKIAMVTILIGIVFFAVFKLAPFEASEEGLGEVDGALLDSASRDSLQEEDVPAIAPSPEEREPVRHQALGYLGGETATGPSTPVDGRILEAGTGRPLAGVKIIHHYPTPREVKVRGPDSRFQDKIEVKPAGPYELATTGPDGRFQGEFEVISSEGAESCDIRFELPGYIPESTVNITAFRDQPLHLGTFLLEPGGILSGRVVNEKGKPVPFASVKFTQGEELLFFRKEKEQHGPSYSNVRVQTVTDEAGQFYFHGVPPGWGRVWATRYGSSYRYTFTDRMEIQLGMETKGVEITLHRRDPDQYIDGIVLSPEGEPVPGARVRYNISASMLGFQSNVTVNDAGRFVIVQADHVYDDARFELRAEHPDGKFGSSQTVDASLKDGNIVLMLTPPRFLELSVATEDGQTPASLKVRLIPVTKVDGLDTSRAYTFGGAEKALKVPMPLQPFILSVEAPGYHNFEQKPIDPGKAQKSVHALLQPLAGITGTVFFENAPLSGVRVRFLELPEPDMEYTSSGFKSRVQPYPAAQDVTDDAGAFRVCLRRSGTFFLHAEKRGFTTTEMGPMALDWEKGRDNIRITLDRKGGTIAGRVVTPDPVSPAGLIVGISRGDGCVQSIRVGEDGAFRFDHLIPGQWEVKMITMDVRPDSRDVYSRRVTDGGEDIPWNCVVTAGEVTLMNLNTEETADTCSLAGTLFVDGLAPAGWTASLKGKNAHIISSALVQSTVDSLGRFTLEFPGEGEFKLELHGATPEGGRLVIFDQVTLTRDQALTWSHDLSTGHLTLKNVPAAMEKINIMGMTVPQFIFRFDGAGDLRVMAELGTQGSGSNLTGTVPAGSGRVVRIVPAMDTSDGYREELMAEVEVPVGKTMQIAIDLDA